MHSDTLRFKNQLILRLFCLKVPMRCLKLLSQLDQREPVMPASVALSRLISWRASCSSTIKRPVGRPSHRCPFGFSAFWWHSPQSAWDFSGTIDRLLLPHWWLVEPSRWLDSTRNCSSCGERRCEWQGIRIDSEKMVSKAFTIHRCGKLLDRAPPSQRASSSGIGDSCAATTNPSCSRRSRRNISHTIWSRARSTC